MMFHLEVLVKPGSVYDSIQKGLGNHVGNDISFLGRRDAVGITMDETGGVLQYL